MKNIIKTIIIVFIILIVLSIVNNYNTHYVRYGTVYSVNNDTITIKDEQGHLWDFIGSDYKLNDNVRMKMHTNYTDNNITDDKIIKIEKVGK